MSDFKCNYTSTMEVILPDNVISLLNRPIVGSGGHQSLLRRLKGSRNGNVQILDCNTQERVVRYCTKYNQGGFQERLEPLMHLILNRAS